MYSIPVKIKLLRADAKIPAYQTPGSAACDLSACLDEPVTLLPGQSALIPTGIAIAPETGDEPVAALLYARSGLAVKHGITLLNCVGVIDADYRGEIKVALINLSAEHILSRTANASRRRFSPPYGAAFFRKLPHSTTPNAVPADSEAPAPTKQNHPYSHNSNFHGGYPCPDPSGSTCS